MPRYRYRGVVQDYEGNALDGAQISVYLQGPRNIQISTSASGTLSGTYYYAVQAQLGDTWSYLSSEVSASADGGSSVGSITITWNEEKGASAYRVWRGTSSQSYTEYVELAGDQISFTDDGSVSWTAGSPTIDGAKVYGDENSTTPITDVPQLTSFNTGYYEFWVDSEDYPHLTRFRIEVIYGPSSFTEDDIIIYPIAQDAYRLAGFSPKYFINALLAGSLYDSYYEEFIYDEEGKVTRVDIYTDSSKTTQIGYMDLTYDTEGKVTQIDAVFNESGLTLNLSYDSNGNPYIVNSSAWGEVGLVDLTQESPEEGSIYADVSNEIPTLKIYYNGEYKDVKVAFADDADTVDGKHASDFAKIEAVGIAVATEDELRTAITDARSDNVRIVVTSPITLTDDLTIPENITLVILQGNPITVPSGYTLTINGPIEAGLWQIFDGDGMITGNPKIEAVCLQWFGAKGDGTTDDTNAVNKAIETISNIGGGKLYISSGTYIINGTINLPNVRIALVGDSVAGTRPEKTILKFNHTDGTPCISFGSRDKEVYLYGFTVEGNSNTGNGLDFNSSGARHIIEKVEVKECGGHGVSLVSTYIVTFLQVESRRNSGCGFYLNNVNECYFMNCAAGSNGEWGIKIENGNMNYGLVDLSTNTSGGIYIDSSYGNVFFGWAEDSAICVQLGASAVNNKLWLRNDNKAIIDEGINNQIYSENYSTSTIPISSESASVIREVENLHDDSSFLFGTSGYKVNGVTISRDDTTGVSTQTSLCIEANTSDLCYTWKTDITTVNAGDVVYIRAKMKASRQTYGDNALPRVKLELYRGTAVGAYPKHNTICTLNNEWRTVELIVIATTGTAEPVGLMVKLEGFNPGDKVWITDILFVVNPPDLRDLSKIPYVITGNGTTKKLTHVASLPAEALAMPPMPHAPANPYPGMITVQDGTNWDPAGTGTIDLVIYDGTTWKKV